MPFLADDFLFLEQVRGKSLLAALFSPDPIGNFFRPVSRALHFWIVTSIAGESPFAFHLVNLVLFLAIVSLLYFVVRRLFGGTAALVAAAFVGVHYAADVPLLWASGSQDLLALTFALAAVACTLQCRTTIGAVCIALALLSKETVALAAPLAALTWCCAERRSWRDGARHAMPLLVVTAAWAVFYLATLTIRPGTPSAVTLDGRSLLGALFHLPQVALALELPWQSTLPSGNAALSIAGCAALIVAAVAIASSRGREESNERGGARLGIVWALAGTVPVALVASIWSAYFYLFALCGVAVAIAAMMARATRWRLVAASVAIVLLNAQASRIEAFATVKSASTLVSHVNAFSLRRSAQSVERYLADLRRARPTLPRESTIFFANLPDAAGFQAGDGPLVRWAYRDSTLRSYFLSDFSSERARRGPCYFFSIENDRLVDKSNDPMLLPGIALSMMLDDKHERASDVLELDAELAGPRLASWLVLTRIAAGDRDAAFAVLRRMRASASLLPAAERARLQQKLAHEPSAAVIDQLVATRDRYPLDPWLQARTAALTLNVASRGETGLVAAYAYHVLAPDDPDAWRKWATAQLSRSRLDGARSSLDRYFELGGAKARDDAEAMQVRSALESSLQVVTASAERPAGS